MDNFRTHSQNLQVAENASRELKCPCLLQTAVAAALAFSLVAPASAASWRSDHGSLLTIEATGCTYFAPSVSVQVVGDCDIQQTGGGDEASFAVDIVHMRVGMVNHFRFGVLKVKGSQDINLQMPGAPGLVRMRYLGGAMPF